VRQPDETSTSGVGLDFFEPLSRIDTIVENAAAADLIAAFFDRARPFDGDLMHTLPGNPPYEVTLEDLYAITGLEVRVRAKGVRSLLQDDNVRERTARLLRKIAVDEDIWEGSADFSDGGPASQLWSFLQELPGVGSVTANKILCRKRPRLLPIVDSVIVEQVNAPEGTYWDVFRTYLADNARRRTVEALRPASLNPLVPTLRILDVVIWMTGSRGRDAKKVRNDLGVPHPPPKLAKGQKPDAP
jgi:hypothetical protein